MSNTCPSRQILRAFQLGDLPEASLEEVAQHVEQCQRCETSAQQLDTAVDSILAALRTPTASRREPTRVLAEQTPVPAERPARPAKPDDFSFLRPAVQPDELGRLAGYRVLRLLGRGGMGYVFHAEDVALRRPVALKVIKPDISRDPEGWQRSLREARIMAAIKHEHLVTIYQAGEENGVIYLAMELLEGESLGDRLDRPEPASLPEIYRLAREIAGGLAVVHQQGLIHRDIKPQNIWLQAPGERVKILDFGLARSVKEDVNLTHPGTIMGTPSFMSPEQASGIAVDARSDLFSLGAVLYQLCTGRGPFQAEHTMAVLTALATATPPPVHELNPSLPPALSDLVNQLLAKDREERPASAEEVVRRLEEIEAGRGEPTRRKAPDTIRRRAALLSVGVIGVALAVWWWLFTGSEPAGQGEVVYLTDLKPIGQENWPFRHGPFGPPGKGPDEGKDQDGKGSLPGKEMGMRALGEAAVVVKGKLSPHGIFMHPPPPPLVGKPASITYRLDGEYVRFQADVSQNDGPPQSSAPMMFSVYGDGNLLWQSEPVQTQDDTQTVDVSVKYVTVLKIEVTCPGVEGAHAVWIEPRVTQ